MNSTGFLSLGCFLDPPTGRSLPTSIVLSNMLRPNAQLLRPVSFGFVCERASKVQSKSVESGDEIGSRIGSDRSGFGAVLGTTADSAAG
mmetsp:Transcript_3602/g.9016  ORF Transcript_3602/g.9016 Transcript_3602/m.9016 type:complete len:89 (-) Transcript_3602:13-279(-)